MYGWVACMHICASSACLVPAEATKGQFSEAGVTKSFESPHGCWELNLGLGKEQGHLSTPKPNFIKHISHKENPVFLFNRILNFYLESIIFELCSYV